MTQQTITEKAILPTETRLGLVTLRVADLSRSLAFYIRVLGFQQLSNDGAVAVLGTDDKQPLLALQELTNAKPRPRRSSGLYHVAILLPTRADLGRVLLRLAHANIPIGQSDHLVSEALYLSDPDGNGLEIYRDRPRETWQWSDGNVVMAIDPLDLKGLIAEAERDGQSGTLLPSGTSIGHIHLQVADLEEAERFYKDKLGFEVTARMPGALFLSAGGYHHHLGLNTWNSQGAAPTPSNSVGLESFTVVLPHQDDLIVLQDRLATEQVSKPPISNRIDVSEPSGHTIHLTV